jgi:hypothetical protein
VEQNNKNIKLKMDKALLELKRLIYDESYQKYIKRIENRQKLYNKLKKLGR